ncbi:MAG: tRNA (N(6)-L-threonylcarbamoyladenosine(37)-C(2))-methylthiotransferase MtaB [Bacillota bacterium]
MEGKRAAFCTLGCKVNQNETEAMEELFRRAGYEIVDFSQAADVYVIHTCTVTHLGDRKSRQMIRRAIRRNPEAVVVASGCYAQIAPGEILAIPGVDLVIGTKSRAEIVELVEQVREKGRPINAVGDISREDKFEEMPIFNPGRVRAFMKIQEGCREFCTYCIIPFARGPVRSRLPANILEETARLVEQGYKELVLTGVHTGVYGQDLAEGIDLNWLLQKLIKVPGLRRIRISSLNPNEFSPALIDTLASSPLICPHLHISLQSGDDEILRRMGRKYSTDQFARLLSELRVKIPDLAVTTDIMVGFPGETREQHQKSLAFVRSQELAGIHVFQYSPRRGTKAAGFPDQVLPAVKEARQREFSQLGQELAHSFASRFLGRTLEVLVEGKDEEGYWEGHTGNYLKVKFSDHGDIRGEIVAVILQEIRDGCLFGSREIC